MANPNPISPWRDYVIQTEQVTVRDYHVRARSEEEALDRFLEGKAHLATLAAPLIERIPGANLKVLMRQRLAEITGLKGDALGPLGPDRAASLHIGRRHHPAGPADHAAARPLRHSGPPQLLHR